MTNEEMLRIKKYWAIITSGEGDVSLLTPEERQDLKQLLEKWLKENYEQDDQT